MNEPLKGYIDNWTAPSRYASIIGRGLKRSMYADKNIVMDLIPADLVAHFHQFCSSKIFLNILLGGQHDIGSCMEYCNT